MKIIGQLFSQLAQQRRAAAIQRVENSLQEFENKCHEPDSGQFCATTGGKIVERAPAAEIAKARTQARGKIKRAPVPTEEKRKKNCAAIAKANKEGKRAGGEFRGSSADRRRRAKQLFSEFGGDKKGYVVCHISGVKMHYTADPTENPKGYPVLSQGKIFTGPQGGSYSMDNLLPELLSANQNRGDKPVRRGKTC